MSISVFEDNHSAASESSVESGLTDFINRRMRGDVPIMGGDPLIGVKELYDAMRTSIATVIPGRKPQILMVNPVDNPSPLKDAAALEMDKIQLMIEQSKLSVSDLSKYLTLIAETQKILVKREYAKARAQIRASSVPLFLPAIYEYKSVFELMVEVDGETAPTNLLWDVRKLERILRYEFKSPTFAAMALTHDSMTPGGESNRVLAHIGDSILRVIAGMKIYTQDGVVSEVHRIIEQYQNNEALRSAGLSLGLADLVRAKPGVDVTSKHVMATVVEAICGAVWLDSSYDVEVMYTIGSLFEAWPAILQFVRQEHKYKDWWLIQDQFVHSWDMEKLETIFKCGKY